MKISVEDINYIAGLAKLRLTPEQAESMIKELERVLSHFEVIDRMDLDDNSPDTCDCSINPVFRQDEVFVFEDKEKLFRNTGAMRDAYIKVPKIIE